MIGGGAVVGKVLGRRKWGQRKAGGFTRGDFAVICGPNPEVRFLRRQQDNADGQMRMGIHPEVFSTFLVSAFAVTACFLSNNGILFDAPTRTR